MVRYWWTILQYTLLRTGLVIQTWKIENENKMNFTIETYVE